MGLDLHRIISGIDIQSNDLSNNAYILQGTGLPGGDGAVQDAAPIGSIFLRNDTDPNNMQLYYKWTTANNSSADWKIVADKAYVDAIASGISWREPVRVLDETAYADNSAFPTTGTVDGISLADGDRVLFSNVTAANESNVWIWDATSSSWSQDSNAASDGDAVLVQDGTHAEQQWVYDGSQWVLFGSAAGTAELGFIRSFIGKTGPGAELPTYSSTDVITQASTLETAIGDLDGVMGTGTITNSGGGYSLTSDLAWATGGTLEITDAFNDINNAIGDRTYTNDNVVVDGQTISSSIDALDTAVGELQDQTQTFKGTNVVASAGVTVDTIPIADATQVKWLIQVRENGTPANRRGLEFHAMTDGSAVDYTRYAVLTHGSAIQGFDVAADINGTDLRLRLTATNNIDFVVRRIAYTAF